MLTLGRRVGEFLLLSPSDYIQGDMTVDELFADGSIEIELKEASGMYKEFDFVMNSSPYYRPVNTDDSIAAMVENYSLPIVEIAECDDE